MADTVNRAGMSCQVGIELEQLDESGARPPDAVVLDMSSLEHSDARRMVEECHDRKLPVLAAVPRDAITTYDPSLNPDDMLVSPVSEAELTARVELAMYRVSGPSGPTLLKVGDLSIDQERYEVTVAGRRVTLTYKEFQLLVLLASNPGRVYTREALLSQIWGYTTWAAPAPWTSISGVSALRWSPPAAPSWRPSGTWATGSKHRFRGWAAGVASKIMLPDPRSW